MIRRALAALYGALLYACPPGFRRAFGNDMRQCARAALASRGAAAMPRLIADLAITAPREWSLARALPGVTAAAWANLVPIAGARVWATDVEGYAAQPNEEVLFHHASVGPEYFSAAGTRLVRGRGFTDADNGSAPPVGIINEAAAKKYWAGRDPVGGRIGAGPNPIEIVGVAETAKVEAIDEEPVPFVYLPFAQDDGGASLHPAFLFVRGSGDAEALLGPLAEQLRAIDREAPVSDVTTFAWRVRELVMPQRMGATLFALFSALALTLAAIGIYGVASYIAALRTRELGIRIVLGADRARIRALVLRQGCVPIAAGLASGIVIAAIASRAAAAFLRGVPPRDPLTYIVVAVLLAAIALIATWIPARRASAIDPMTALRQE